VPAAPLVAGAVVPPRPGSGPWRPDPGQRAAGAEHPLGRL